MPAATEPAEPVPYFFASEIDGDEVRITGDDARHLAGPLRARAGELIEVVEVAGRLLGVRLRSVSMRAVVGSIEWSREHRPEPHSAVWLAIAMLPAAGLEHVLSRATELGVAGFFLIKAERSVARGDKHARWATISREAAMLAGRLVVPEIIGPVGLHELAPRGPLVLLDREAPRRLAEVAAGSAPGASTLAIGPEGGWSPGELERAGAGIASLGPRNLRADTAALAAVTVWLSNQADL